MTRKTINLPRSAPTIAPFSSAVSAGGVVYVSGILPLDDFNNVIAVGDPEAQTRHVIETIASVLAAAGTTLSNVTFNSIFLTDWSHYPAINRVYAEYFRPDWPARYCVKVELVKPEALVEIASIAHMPS